MRGPSASKALLSAVLVALASPPLPTSLRAQNPQPAPGSQRATTASLHGRVIDAATGRTLQGAELTAITGSDTLHARTDANGAWQLAVTAAEPVAIRARMLGYAPRELTVPGNDGAVATSASLADGSSLVLRLTPVPVSLDAVVVSAARREQRLGDAVVTTEIISHSDIERSGASDVASALLEHTGIQIDGGVPTGTGVQLQGFGEERVLVLLDGQPLQGRVNGNFDMSRLPASMVERVEVVKGPQSTLFGSDAMGGVVNIITRSPVGAPATGTLSLTAGSFGRRDASASIVGSEGRFGYSFDGGYRYQDLTPGFADDDYTRSKRWNGRVRASYSISPELTLESSILAIDDDQRYRTGATNFQFSDNEQRGARIGATWKRGSHSLTPLLYYSRFEHLSRASDTPKPVSDSGSRDLQELSKLDLIYSGELDWTTIDAGLELKRERLTADRLRDAKSRSLDAIEPYLQLTIGRGPFSVVPGVRMSWNEEWGRTTTPRLAALYRPIPSLAVRASVARGFRAPGFKELYLDYANPQAGYAVHGNPDLRPESSVSTMLGVEWAGRNLYARATGFHNDFKNFIETFMLGGQPGVFSYGNIASGRTDGVELETGVTAGRARIEAGYAFLSTRDDATGQELLGRPRHSGRLSLGYAAWTGFDASVAGTISGRVPTQRDREGNISESRRSFPRLDFHARQAVMDGVSVALNVDNVFDEEMGDAWPGFTGRMVSFGLTWQPFDSFR
ncbi:MAG TPA: TonB-dependent receptor [Gemmatimonadaceae bacterium]|nr:TonB-dependent receptor [Gemmatimonadaceae bacterium]